MRTRDTQASGIAYPQLIGSPLTDQLFQESGRLRNVTDTIWWQVLVDPKQKRIRGGNAQECVDLDANLAVECEKRLMLIEQGSTTSPDPVTYVTRKYVYNIFVPGLFQFNQDTMKRRPVRRLAVTHASDETLPGSGWSVVMNDFPA
jgi:hypothetical protein